MISASTQCSAAVLNAWVVYRNAFVQKPVEGGFDVCLKNKDSCRRSGRVSLRYRRRLAVAEMVLLNPFRLSCPLGCTLNPSETRKSSFYAFGRICCD